VFMIGPFLLSISFFVIPPYGSMVGILSLLCLYCTVTDFSAAEKDSGVKLRMFVRLLSGMSFFRFGELWPRGVVWWDLRLAGALVFSFLQYSF